MRKYLLIGVSICSIMMLLLCSFTTVTGASIIQSSNLKTVTEKNNQNSILQFLLHKTNYLGKSDLIRQIVNMIFYKEQKRMNILNTKRNEINWKFIQFSTPNCDCEQDLKPIAWTFPVICAILLNLFVLSALLNLQSMVEAILDIAIKMHCSWAPSF